MGRCFFSSIFCLLSLVPATTAQTCSEQARQRAQTQASATVSLSFLQMPAKAKRSYEKARQAAEANQTEVFEHEAAATLAIAPNFAEIYLLRAALQVHNGLNEEAILSIATARQMQHEMPLASIVVASALNQMSRYAEAAAELDRFHSLNQNWQWGYEKTRAELGLRHIDGALHWSLLTLEDVSAECSGRHLLRINALEMAGLRREAIEEMEFYLGSGKNLPQQEAVMHLLDRERKIVGGNTASVVATR